MYLKFVYYIFFSCIIIFTQCSEKNIDKSKLEIFKCESVFDCPIEAHCLLCELCPENIYYYKKDMDITELCTKSDEVIFTYKNLFHNIKGKYSPLDIEKIVKKYIKDKNFKDCFIRIQVYEDGYVIDVNGKKYYNNHLYVYIIPDKVNNEKYYTVFKMSYDDNYYLDNNYLFFYKSGENKNSPQIELKVLPMKNINKTKAGMLKDVKNSKDYKDVMRTSTTTQQDHTDNSSIKDNKKSYKKKANMSIDVKNSNNVTSGHKDGIRTSTTTQQNNTNNSAINDNKKPCCR